MKFFLGHQQGAVSEVVYNKDGRGTGVRTRDGKFHPAELVIVAAGAGVGKLLPSLGTQIVAKSWSVAHVQLSDEETSALRGIPITYARDFGFYFEPDPKTNLLKICPMGGGYINTDPATGVSHAPEDLETSQFLPAEDEGRIRKLLEQTLPALAKRPLVKRTLCWFADTKDSDFIVDYVPGSNGNVVVLSGDSGHGFKLFPIVGEWTRDLLAEKSKTQKIARWRWKNESQDKPDWGTDVSWRLGETRELRDVLPGRVKL